MNFDSNVWNDCELRAFFYYFHDFLCVYIDYFWDNFKSIFDFVSVFLVISVIKE